MTVPLPPDPVYQQQINNASTALQQQIAGFLRQRGQAASDYGYTPTYDANGYVSALSVDKNNPYAKSALLQQSFENNVRGTTNNYASRGQLYSGAIQSAQGENTRQYNIASDSLQKAFENFIAQNQQQISEAKQSYSTNLTNAMADRLDRAQQYASSIAPAPAPAPAPARAAAPAPAATKFKPGTKIPIVTPGTAPSAGSVGWDPRGFYVTAGIKNGKHGIWHQYPNGKNVFVPK